MRARKIVWLVCTSLAACSFSACGDDEETSPSSTKDASTDALTLNDAGRRDSSSDASANDSAADVTVDAHNADSVVNDAHDAGDARTDANDSGDVGVDANDAGDANIDANVDGDATADTSIDAEAGIATDARADADASPDSGDGNADAASDGEAGPDGDASADHSSPAAFGWRIGSLFACTLSGSAFCDDSTGMFAVEATQPEGDGCSDGPSRLSILFPAGKPSPGTYTLDPLADSSSIAALDVDVRNGEQSWNVSSGTLTVSEQGGELVMSFENLPAKWDTQTSSTSGRVVCPAPE